jgi:hypothetical protein
LTGLFAIAGATFLGASIFSTGLTIFLTSFFGAEVFVFNFHTLDFLSLTIFAGALFGAECFVPGLSILVFAEAENASISLNVRCLA